MIGRETHTILRCVEHGTYHGTAKTRCPQCLLQGQALQQPEPPPPTVSEIVTEKARVAREDIDE